MFPTQITLRGLNPDAELSSRVRDLSEKLSLIHPAIQTCRVAIEQAVLKSRGRAEPLGPFTVEMHVRLPGRELDIEPQSDVEPAGALRKAFSLTRRQLRQIAELDREARRLAIRACPMNR